MLNDSHWPISGTQKFPLVLGPELQTCQESFQKYYDGTTEKRRLQWLYNYGTVTLNARFTNAKLPIQLILTPLQSCIIMCFNERPKLSFDELSAALWPSQSTDRRAMTYGFFLRHCSPWLPTSTLRTLKYCCLSPLLHQGHRKPPVLCTT